MNKSLISRKVNECIESKPTRSEKTKYLLKHVLGNFNLDWLKELAAVLENDPGNRQNQEAGRMLMAAILVKPWILQQQSIVQVRLCGCIVWNIESYC